MKPYPASSIQTESNILYSDSDLRDPSTMRNWVNPYSRSRFHASNQDSSKVLKASLKLAQHELKSFLQSSDFQANMDTAFGSQGGTRSAAALIRNLSRGKAQSLPRFEIRSALELQGANGAFAKRTNTIYLSNDFLRQNAANPKGVTSVVLEELGHWVDSRLNTGDAAGDEGEIFADLVQGKPLGTTDLALLKAEDDTATFTLNGQPVAVEMSQMAMSIFGNRLFEAHQGYNNKIYIRSSSDGTTWSGWTDTGRVTRSAPSMAIFGNKLFMAHQGTDNHIYTRWTTDGVNWSSWAEGDNGSTFNTPIMSQFNGRLYQTVRGTDNRIYVRSTANGTTWNGWSATGGGLTLSAPALSTFGGRLYQAVRGTGNGVHVRSTSDGTTWTPWTQIDGSTSSAPTLSFFGNQLFLSMRGTDNKIYTRSTGNGSTWSGWSQTSEWQTPSAPSLSVFGSKLFQSIQGLNDRMYTRSFDGRTWSGWTLQDGLTPTEIGDVTDNLTDEQYKWRAEYYNNRSLSGAIPTFSQIEGGSSINKEWGMGGPGNGVGNDNFSARWTGAFKFDGGFYNFKSVADDGIRIWVDDRLVMDQWRDQAAQFQAGVNLSRGVHTVKVEYYENGGGATAKVWWEKGSRLTQLADKSSSFTINEIQEYRQLVSQLPEGERATWYRKLQFKTPYFNQRDNGYREIADVMCNVTTLASCLTALGVKNPNSAKQFEDALEDTLRANPTIYPSSGGTNARYWWSNLSKLATNFGVRSSGTQYLKGFSSSDTAFFQNFVRTNWEPALNQGKTIMAGSYTTASGHIIRVIDVDWNRGGIVVDDPYGKAQNSALNDYKRFNYSGSQNTTLRGGINTQEGQDEGGSGNDNFWAWSYCAEVFGDTYYLLLG